MLVGLHLKPIVFVSVSCFPKYSTLCCELKILTSLLSFRRCCLSNCRPCKTRKVKCDETKPACNNCAKQGEVCDYSIRLNWEGRGQKKAEKERAGYGQIIFEATASEGSPSSVGSAGLRGGIRGQSHHDHSGFSHGEYRPDGSSIGSLRQHTGTPTYGTLYQPNDTQRTSHPPSSIEEGNYVQAKRPNSEPPFFEEHYAQSYNDLAQSPRPHERAQRIRSAGLRSYTSEMLTPQTVASDSLYDARSYTSSPSSMSRPFSSGPLLSPTSATNDEYQSPYTSGSVTLMQESSDARLSINSLLSNRPVSQPYLTHPRTPRSNSDNQDAAIQYRDIYTDHTTWGIDRGNRDLDYGKNDDANAISPTSSMTGREHLSMILNDENTLGGTQSSVGSPRMVSEEAAYYKKPVPINIPKLLEPLPPLLLENPMNLLVSSWYLSQF